MAGFCKVFICGWIALTMFVGSAIKLDAQPPITATAFTPDGRAVLIGSQLGVQVLSWPGLEPMDQLQSKISNLHDIAFSPSGAQLAVAGGDPAENGEIEIFTWPAGSLSSRLTGHNDSVMSVVWIDELQLASAGLDQRVIVWNTTTGVQTQVLVGHSRGIGGLALVKAANVLVSGSRDQSLRIWDLQTGQLKNSLTNHTQPIHRLAVRPNSSPLAMVASASDDRTVRLWQPTIGRMVRFARLAAKPLDICWLPDGSRLVAGCDDGAIYLIDPDTIQVTDKRQVIQGGWIYTVTADLNGSSILVGGSHGKLVKVDL